MIFPPRNHSKFIYFFILLCLCLPALVLAQVTIRERVEVKPNAETKQISRSSQSTQASEIRIESSFDGPLDPNRTSGFYISGPCGAYYVSSNISGTATVPAYAGTYMYTYGFTTPSGGTLRYYVYFGDSAIVKIEWPVVCPNGCRAGSGTPSFGLSAGFTLSGLRDEIDAGGYNDFKAVPSMGPPCSPAVIYNGWPIELEITKGLEVGCLYQNRQERSNKMILYPSQDPYEIRWVNYDFFNFVADGEIGCGV